MDHNVSFVCALALLKTWLSKPQFSEGNASMKFNHVDVFTETAYGGNSLTVFTDVGDIAADARLSITREMRHFESIFLHPTSDPQLWCAQVVALDGELPFAGHPLLGAAAVLHEQSPRESDGPAQWTFALAHRQVNVVTQSHAKGIHATLELDAPIFGDVLDDRQTAKMLEAFGLNHRHRHASLAPAIVDVGLRYLIVPVAGGLAQAGVRVNDLGVRLESLGAELAYLIEVRQDDEDICLEARHWTNDGLVEDVATGSGAAAAAAFLGANACIKSNQWHVIRQGRFAGRPSEIGIAVEMQSNRVSRIRVAGSVVAVGEGKLIALPQATTSQEICHE